MSRDAARRVCGRTDIVTVGPGERELLFRCDREYRHEGRHHAQNVEGVELFWAPSGGSPRVMRRNRKPA